jgi:hypothetical protein
MTRSNFNDYVTLDIAGGPPGQTATVLVGGTVCQRVVLDGWGTGSVRVTATSSDPYVEITVEDTVLLTGRLPARPSFVGGGS